MSIYIFNIGLGGGESAFLFLGNISGGKWAAGTRAAAEPLPHHKIRSNGQFM